MKKLSKLNQRRLNNFRSNKRGYYSFWIFAFLFFISLFADFIANEKPLLVKYNSNFIIQYFLSIQKQHLEEILKQRQIIKIHMLKT